MLFLSQPSQFTYPGLDQAPTTWVAYTVAWCQFTTTALLHYVHLTASFSRTTWVSWHQKGRIILDFNEARDNGWQWHQLDYMQIICTLLQTVPHHSVFTGWMPFLPPNQQCQSTERKSIYNKFPKLYLNGGLTYRAKLSVSISTTDCT